MKKLLVISLLTLVNVAALAQSEKEQNRNALVVARIAQKPETATLASVVKLVDKSLQDAQGELAKSNLGLVEAEITLMTTKESQGGGGFSIIVKASRKWSKEVSNSTTYKFTKPLPEEKLAAEPKDAFAKAIIAAAKDYRSSISLASLKKDGFESQVSFSVNSNGGVGVSLDIFDVELAASADFDRTVFIVQNSLLRK